MKLSNSLSNSALYPLSLNFSSNAEDMTLYHILCDLIITYSRFVGMNYAFLTLTPFLNRLK